MWLQSLHPGVTLGPMMCEGGQLDHDTEMSDWMSTTSTSDIRVTWTAWPTTQKIWLWTPDGEIDLGDEDYFGQSEEEL
jgi:hypothetical protein